MTRRGPEIIYLKIILTFFAEIKSYRSEERPGALRPEQPAEAAAEEAGEAVQRRSRRLLHLASSECLSSYLFILFSGPILRTLNLQLHRRRRIT
jgi:hypothetical protein